MMEKTREKIAARSPRHSDTAGRSGLDMSFTFDTTEEAFGGGWAARSMYRQGIQVPKADGIQIEIVRRGGSSAAEVYLKCIICIKRVQIEPVTQNSRCACVLYCIVSYCNLHENWFFPEAGLSRNSNGLNWTARNGSGLMRLGKEIGSEMQGGCAQGTNDIDVVIFHLAAVGPPSMV